MNSEREMENLKGKVEIPPPTYNEINGIIQKLRNNKAPGPKSIILKPIKEGQQLKHRIYILILKIWEKEIIPVDWKYSIIHMSNLQKE